MIECRELPLPGVVEIVAKRHGDARGFFSETYNRKTMAEIGIGSEFVQDNHSRSARRGTVRGLHYQLPRRAQAKLVRVTRGAIFDVVVDIRRDSPTFGRWISLQISAEKWNQLFIPEGFAHGFQTLEPETEVTYKVTDFYSPEHDRSIRFDDPQIAIDWPLAVDEAGLSAKDRAAPKLADAEVFGGLEVS